MSYTYYIRGWMELSWPIREVEGMDESAEEHADKVQRVREALTTRLSHEELLDSHVPTIERYKAGWGFPQDGLDGNEYIFFGADVEEPMVVRQLIAQVLNIDPYADGYFSVERDDGEQCRQWLVKGGKAYAQRALFPDFDAEEVPTGYVALPDPS
jgi:hypothetical protein